MDEIVDLLEAGRQRGIDVSQVSNIVVDNDRNVAMAKLRDLGFAIIDIAEFYKITRARVCQLVRAGQWARPRDYVIRSVADIRGQVWCEACNDLSWWGNSGRLDRDRIVRLFLDAGYSWDVGRISSKSVSASGFDVIMATKFGVVPEDQAQWLQQKIDELDKPKWAIFEMMNTGQKLQISRGVFIRRWGALGIVSPRRIK